MVSYLSYLILVRIQKDFRMQMWFVLLIIFTLKSFQLDKFNDLLGVL